VTLLPTVEVSQVCATPSTAENRNSPTIASTSRIRSPISGLPPSVGNSASSKMRCTISGGMTAIPAPTTTRMPVRTMRPRYGRNSATTRFPSPAILGACAFSFFCAASSTPRKPPPPPPRPPPIPPMLMGSA
jgi:hypothetical protein